MGSVRHIVLEHCFHPAGDTGIKQGEERDWVGAKRKREGRRERTKRKDGKEFKQATGPGENLVSSAFGGCVGQPPLCFVKGSHHVMPPSVPSYQRVN